MEGTIVVGSFAAIILTCAILISVAKQTDALTLPQSRSHFCYNNDHNHNYQVINVPSCCVRWSKPRRRRFLLQLDSSSSNNDLVNELEWLLDDGNVNARVNGIGNNLNKGVRESKNNEDQQKKKQPLSSPQQQQQQKQQQQQQQQPPTELLSRLSKDLARLTALRPPTPSSDFSQKEAIVSAGSSYTRLWTHTTWTHHATPPHVRYARHIRKWPLSTSARKILPAVTITAVYSLIMSFSLRHIRIGQYHLVAMTKGASAAITALSAPLALLLTLRANASLGRLNEARGVWGRLVLRGRNLASVLKVYVYPTHPHAAVLATRYLTVFGWSIKALVRNESIESQYEMYETMLGSKEAEWLCSQNIRPPIAILLRLRQIIAKVSKKKENCNNLHFVTTHTSMEKAIDDLDTVTGVCERLLTSPIPPTYSRHLSRIMVMYLAILPFALVASGLPSLGAVVASTIVSYVLIGVDEIGMEIENPFQLLPLQQICAALQGVVGEQLLLVVEDEENDLPFEI